MAFMKDTQKPIMLPGPGRRNPRITDGTTEVEFTYPPGRADVDLIENASFAETAGGQARKQADTLLRGVTLEWIEPSNYVPATILELMRGAGDRTRILTYKHHREILSQLGDGIELEAEVGVGQLVGHIRDFKATRIGKDISGTQIYSCRMVFQEANEVTP